MKAEEVRDRLQCVLVDAHGGMDLFVAGRLVLDFGEEIVEAWACGEPLTARDLFQE